MKIKPLILMMMVGVWGSYAAEKVPVELKEVGIEEHLGRSISPDLAFTDETGKTVPFRNYFNRKYPVILTLVYYNCPNLCHYLLDGFTKSLQKLSWTVGKEFRVVTVSIDPIETHELSQKKKKYRLQKYGRLYSSDPLSDGWTFLTGSEKNIRQLADDIGFHYRYDEDRKEYAHSAAVFVLTPEGKISRYLYGIEFKPLDLKLSLLEAAQGKIGNVVDKLLLFCYHYDPKGRKYAIFAVNLMKLGGVVAVVGVLALVSVGSGILSRRKKTRFFR